MNVKQALEIQATLTGCKIPEDLATALEDTCRVNGKGEAVMLADMNLVCIIRAYLKDQEDQLEILIKTKDKKIGRPKGIKVWNLLEIKEALLNGHTIDEVQALTKASRGTVSRIRQQLCKEAKQWLERQR